MTPAFHRPAAMAPPRMERITGHGRARSFTVAEHRQLVY
jgi:hypothetical protein